MMNLYDVPHTVWDRAMKAFVDPRHEWPVWLNADSFAGWYAAESLLRKQAGDEPLGPPPQFILDEVYRDA